jgi:hypothetical protein
MALDLEIAGEIRELTDAELAEAKASTAKPPTIKRLRDSHHAVARALALGCTPQQVSLATGYSLSRISILQTDPSFIDLMTHYRRTHDEAVLDMEGRIVGLAADFLQELRERLEDAPESFDNEEVRENYKLLLDRAGYAPISRSININKSVGIGDRLDRLNQRGKREDAA